MEQKTLAFICEEAATKPWELQEQNPDAYIQSQITSYKTSVIEKCIHGTQVVSTTDAGAGVIHVFDDYDHIMPFTRILNVNLLRLVQKDRLRRGLGVFVHLHRYVPAHVLLAIICQYANVNNDGVYDKLRPALERLDKAVDSGLSRLGEKCLTNPNDTALRTFYEQAFLSRILHKSRSSIIYNGPGKSNLDGRFIGYEPVLPHGNCARLHFISGKGQSFSLTKAWTKALSELTDQQNLLAGIEDDRLRVPSLAELIKCTESERTGVQETLLSFFILIILTVIIVCYVFERMRALGVF